MGRTEGFAEVQFEVDQPVGQIVPILISGHTDSLGSEKYNMKLSKARADKLKSLLQSRYDISSERLITVGFGETMNLKGKASNHPANRRVQLYNITQIR